jgi:hypothetical protein
MLRRFTRNLIVDGLAFAGFLLLTTTGILMRYLLPPGSGRRTAIWGLDRHGWGDFHFWIAVTFLALLSFHLVLHWRWIAAVLRGRPREGSGLRVGLGLTGLAAVIALAVAPLLTPPERIAAATSGRGQLSHPGAASHSVLGQLTLRELETQTGVPAGQVLRALGLPDDIARDQRLGRLRRQYGFEMGDVRRIIEDHRGNE